MALSIFVINISQIVKTVMQDKIFKVKIFEVTHKSVESVKIFSPKYVGYLRSYNILS